MVRKGAVPAPLLEPLGYVKEPKLLPKETLTHAEVMKLLMERGVDVAYHDPFVPRLHPMRRHDIPLESVPLKPSVLQGFDFAVIVTNHSGVPYDLVVDHVPLVVDTRNACAGVRDHRERIVKA